MSRKQLTNKIHDLYDKIDTENEKKEELLFTLAETERAIERWKSLLEDMEALLK